MRQGARTYVLAFVRQGTRRTCLRSCVRARARMCSRSCVGGARARAHVCAVAWPDQRLGAKAQPEGQEMRMKQQLSEASPTQLESPASPWTRPWPSASACVPSSPRRGPGACDRCGR